MKSAQTLFFTRDAYPLTGLCPSCYKDCTVSFLHKIIDCVLGINGRIITNLHTTAFYVFDLCLDHITGESKFRHCNP